MMRSLGRTDLPRLGGVGGWQSRVHCPQLANPPRRSEAAETQDFLLQAAGGVPLSSSKRRKAFSTAPSATKASAAAVVIAAAATAATAAREEHDISRRVHQGHLFFSNLSRLKNIT
jgi:hypothetical protein